MFKLKDLEVNSEFIVPGIDLIFIKKDNGQYFLDGFFYTCECLDSIYRFPPELMVSLN